MYTLIQMELFTVATLHWEKKWQELTNWAGKIKAQVIMWNGRLLKSEMQLKYKSYSGSLWESPAFEGVLMLLPFEYSPQFNVPITCSWACVLVSRVRYCGSGSILFSAAMQITAAKRDICEQIHGGSWRIEDGEWDIWDNREVEREREE